MTSQEAEVVFEANYAAWKARREAKVASTRAIVLAALEAGKTVVEFGIGSQPVYWADNRIHKDCEPFSPAAMTQHLMARFRGFGTTLVIDGIEYDL